MTLPQLSLRESFWLVLVLAMGCNGSSPPIPPRPIPVRQDLSHVYKALEGASEVYLYSLEPTEVKTGGQLGGWQSRGRVKLEGNSREELVDAFKTATEYKTPIALCFEPHHGIRAIDGETEMDLIICFSCFSLEVQVQGKQEFYSIDRSGRQLFNRLLKEAQLPYEEMSASP